MWFNLLKVKMLLLLIVVMLGSSSGTWNSDTYHKKHGSFEEDDVKCTITEDSFLAEYSIITAAMGIYDPQTGENCSSSTEDKQFRADSVCETLLNFSRRLLIGLNVTPECCLSNITDCSSDSHSEDKVKVYGYGALMVLVLSLLSLLGVIIVPLIKNEKCGHFYEYVNLFLIAMGSSALLCDAVLHLIPQVFEMLIDEEDDWERRVLWRACAIAGGIYFFYIFEMILHKAINRNHKTTIKDQGSRESLAHDSTHLIKNDYKSTSHENYDIEHTVKSNCCNPKPLAVLIIVGDAFHNFTDGITLGAALSQNFTLGISTLIALSFHEIPHELGDYAILLSTGMHWYTALFFNFLSSITAIVGFFIGASVGLESQEANGWMLAVASGTFIYIALVDLVPLIMHSKLKGFLPTVLTNLGFLLSFGILLLVAIYE